MRQSRLLPLIIATALFMENMDSTVISTSLPMIARDLGEDPIALKLAITSYLVSLAIFIPISGWMADKYGARTVFRAAIGVFMAGSLACASADSLAGFVIARFAQGVGGAMMVPVGRLVLLRSVPRNEIVQALATLTIPALVGPVVGPPLGGFITTYFDWRWIFFINIPIGVLGIVLATIYVPNIREDDTPPLDLVGFLLSGLGLALLMLGFALFRIGVGSIPFLLPLMLQIGFGLNPLASGSLTFIAAVGALFMKTMAKRILERTGFRLLLTVNAFIGAGFVAANGFFTPSTPYWLIMLVLFVGGCFRSLQFTSLNAIAYAEVSNRDMSYATSLSSVAQQLSLSIGVALGAFALEAASAARGTTQITAADFGPAF